jgi:uncharacterized membrane protein YebE (DUF533 family)
MRGNAGRKGSGVSGEVVAAAARAATAQLARELGLPALEVDVEMALYANGRDDARPVQYADPVAVAGLIVAAAQFAYQVYTDQKKRHRARPAHETVARQTRIHLRESGEATKTHQLIVDAVVTEVLKAADDE